MWAQPQEGRTFEKTDHKPNSAPNPNEAAGERLAWTGFLNEISGALQPKTLNPEYRARIKEVMAYTISTAQRTS